MSFGMLGFGDTQRTRETILRAIRDHPGINRSGLCRVTGLAWGTVSHHTAAMGRKGEIHLSREGRQELLFPRGCPESQMGVLAAVRDAEAQGILDHLAASPRLGISELSHRRGVSRKVVRRHLTRLVAAGLVQQTRPTRPRFELAPDALQRVGALARGLHG